MLERVALHQTRFRTPGVVPDERGVLLGARGLVLLPSLDRLVAFLRAYSEEGSLDELLPSLEIRRLVTPLKTRELMLAFAAESSYRMDRIAGIAKLAGGFVFTGTSRHFVKYRDSLSPLGYDLQELVEQPADLVLYHDSFQQTYSFERELPLRELVFKLGPEPVAGARAQPTPTRLWVTSEVGVGGAILSYLFRWQVPARAGLAEWPPSSAFEDRPRRLYLIEIDQAPARVVSLLAELPGVGVFEPLSASVAVELGYRHPLDLQSCASLFDDESLTLFAGRGPVLVARPVPPLAPIRSLVRAPVHLDEQAAVAVGAPAESPPELSLPLRLAPSTAPWRAVTATVVPRAQSAWLGKLLYALPPTSLEGLRLAVGRDRYFLLDPRGVEGVPLGTFHTEVAPRIFVPAGRTLVPAVRPEVLQELLRGRGDGYVFFDPRSGQPEAVPAAAFGPVSRRALRHLDAAPVAADPLIDEEPPLPLLRYDRPRRFPLWGIEERGDEAGGSE